MDPDSMAISNFYINELLLRKNTTPKSQWLASMYFLLLSYKGWSSAVLS